VRRGTEEQRPRSLALEPSRGRGGSAHGRCGETRCTPRLSCQAGEGSQKVGRDGHGGLDELAIAGPRGRGRFVEGAADEKGGTVVERMRERGRGLDPLQVEVERAEERRGSCEGMDRRADIVPEAG
jgi:hypothetical protein